MSHLRLFGAVRRLAGVLVLVAAACTHAPPSSAPAVAPPKELPDGGGAESDGLTLITQVVKMNGELDGTCALAPERDGGAHVTLTLRSACPTVGALDVTVKTVKDIVRGSVPRTLDAGVTTEIDQGPSFPLPPAGSLVRTGVTATCAGAGRREVWAGARCLVPKERK